MWLVGFHGMSYVVFFWNGLIISQYQLHPRKLTWSPKNGGWVQMIFLFKGVIFRFQSLVFGAMHLFPSWIIMNHSYRRLKTSSEMQVDDFWPAAVKMISDMGFLQSLLLVKRCVVWRWWWEGYSPQELRYPTLGKGGNHFQQCPWKWDMSVFPVRGICFECFGSIRQQIEAMQPTRQTFDKDNIPPAEPAENLMMTWTD